MQKVEFLTAETKQGKLAIEEVMKHSYSEDIDAVPAQWAIVRIVDDVPVSFILVDPCRQIETQGSYIRYAFINDVATRDGRRMEGHFRSIMEYVFSKLRSIGVSIVILHGDYRLYRKFGFDVFTHHCGIFATPELIERNLGILDSTEGKHILAIEDSDRFHDDLLLISNVKAETFTESKIALRLAAAVARENCKTRILFEYPPAPSHGSQYPVYPSLETPFIALARACGAKILIQGDDPEDGPTCHADWIKVLDTAALLREALNHWNLSEEQLPQGTACFDTYAGCATIESSGNRVIVLDGVKSGTSSVKWQSSAIAQLVTGYRSAEILCTVHDTPLSTGTLKLLNILFPQQFRFTRNENWVFKG